MLPPVLGALGLLTSGPLIATVLIGRTGPVPSVRWAGLALAVWLALGALGVALGRGERRARVERLLAALSPLALVAAAAPLLPLLYLDDEAFHLVRASAAGVQVCVFAVALAALGFTLASGRATEEAGAIPAAPEHFALSPAVAAPLAGIFLMVSANDLLFEPLGVSGANPGLWLANLGGVALAAWLLTLGSGAVPAVAVALAVAVSVPLQGQLATAPSGVILGLMAAAVAGAMRLGRSGPAHAALLVAVACLAVAATAWLKPSLPPLVTAAPAVLAVGVAARPAFWRALPRNARIRLAAPLALGYVLASISPERLGLAAREAIAAWPALAHSGTAGLLLVAVALLFRPLAARVEPVEAA